MTLTIHAGDYHLARIGQSDTAEHVAVFLDADRKKALVVLLLPDLHALIELLHGLGLEVENVPLVFAGHCVTPLSRFLF